LQIQLREYQIIRFVNMLIKHVEVHNSDIIDYSVPNNDTSRRRPSCTAAIARSAQHSPHLENGSKISGFYASTEIVMEVDLESPVSPADPSPWIGGTGLGNVALGKSGRVIERLMAENDRLKRDLRSEIAKREELQRSLQTQKPKLDSLQAENARLTNIKSMDDNIISRRDRKIDELRHELEIERQKRDSAEQRCATAENQKEELEDSSKKEIQCEREQARHATLHAEILQTSHLQLSREYRQRIASTSKAIRDLGTEREEDRKRMARLDIVTSSMRQETERLRCAHGGFVTVWQRFQSAKQQEFDELESNAHNMTTVVDSQERLNVKLAEDMTETMSKMKWVMQLQQLGYSQQGE